MREFIVKLEDKYDIPQNILAMSPTEWGIILTNISKLLLAHDSISLKINTDSIEQLYQAKYAGELTTRDQQLQAKIQELEELQTTHEKQLKKQRKDLEANFKVSSNESMQSKDALIQSMREQNADLIKSLSERVAPLQEQIQNKTVEIEELHATYEKQRKDLEEQHRQANKKAIRDALESKDAVINSLKEQIADATQHYNAQLKPLQIQIQNKSLEVEQLHATYEKQRKDLEEQYQQAKNKAIHAALESKDAVINSLNEQLKPLQTQNNILRDQLTEQQILTARAVAEEKVKLTNDIHKEYKEQINQLITKHSSELQQAYRECNEKTDLIREEITANNYLAISKSLEPITKYYGGSNQEKGDGGELAIRQVLQRAEKYDDAVIEDVSGQAASGDVYFKWRNMSCLIEIKNKATLTKEDIAKFERDIIESSKKLNCAMFISTRTKSFPIQNGTRDIMQLSYVQGVPVMYVYAPPPSNEIHFALACLDRIIQTSEATSQEHAELREQFIEYYNYVLCYQKFFDKKLKDSQREVKDLLKHSEKFNALCERLSPIYARLSSIEPHDELDEERADESTDEQIDELDDEPIESNRRLEPLRADPEEQFQQLIEEYIKLSLRSESPTIQMLSQSFNVSTKTIEKIGFKKIAAAAHNKYLMTYITAEKAAAVIAFYNKHNHYPNRKELAHHKLVPDYVLRNISKVTKQKKVAECIAGFIEQTYTAPAE
jgi:hypothetical protein